MYFCPGLLVISFRIRRADVAAMNEDVHAGCADNEGRREQLDMTGFGESIMEAVTTFMVVFTNHGACVPGTRPTGRGYGRHSMPAGTGVDGDLCPTGKPTRVRKYDARTRKPAKPSLTCGAIAEAIYMHQF
jgi:hypothetical protein